VDTIVPRRHWGVSMGCLLPKNAVAARPKMLARRRTVNAHFKDCHQQDVEDVEN
jgi:hypothetical protein